MVSVVWYQEALLAYQLTQAESVRMGRVREINKIPQELGRAPV